jgi:hypothetical protein
VTVTADLPAVTAVKLCLFRTCTWQIDADTPEWVLEELIAGHLLQEHREELCLLGRLAEHGELVS